MRKSRGCSSLRSSLPFFLLGGGMYTLIELIWRHRTHPSMFVAGGLCFVLLDRVSNVWMCKRRLVSQCAVGALLITLVELVVGLIVNVLLGWAVWDYSSMKYQFKGQVCLLYSILWFFLCFPACLLCKLLHKIPDRLRALRQSH